MVYMANVGQFTAARKWVKSFPSNGRHPLICWDKLGPVSNCTVELILKLHSFFCLNCCDWYSGDSAGGLRDVGRLQIRGLRSEDQMQGSTADFRIQTIWRAAHVLNSTGCTPRGLHRLQHSCQWHMSDSDTVRFGGS